MKLTCSTCGKSFDSFQHLRSCEKFSLLRTIHLKLTLFPTQLRQFLRESFEVLKNKRAYAAILKAIRRLERCTNPPATNLRIVYDEQNKENPEFLSFLREIRVPDRYNKYKMAFVYHLLETTSRTTNQELKAENKQNLTFYRDNQVQYTEEYKESMLIFENNLECLLVKIRREIMNEMYRASPKIKTKKIKREVL